MKKLQEELKTNTAEEITELKKETDHLIVEKDHLFDIRVQVEAAVVDTCKHVDENVVELYVVKKTKRLGEIIV